MSDNVYFEPPSRLQLVDKLTHLLRFSNTFLVLAGPAGAGVSTTLEQLHLQIGEDDAYILALELKAKTNLNALLKLMNGAMDELLEPAKDENSDQLSALHQKIEALAKFHRKLLISIDNANYLSDEGIECLVNLIQANPDEIRIAIAGSQDLVGLVAGAVADQSPLDIIHNEMLGPFNRLESEEFIQLRFVRGGDFSTKQLNDIYLKSQGYPGLILQLTNEMIKSGKIRLSNKNSILPVPHIIGIAVLLTAITTVSSWQYFSDDSIVEETLVDEQGGKALVVANESKDATSNIAFEVEQHSERAASLEQQISSLSTKIKAQELLIETAREDSIPQRNSQELKLDESILASDTALENNALIASKALVLQEKTLISTTQGIPLALNVNESEVQHNSQSEMATTSKEPLTTSLNASSDNKPVDKIVDTVVAQPSTDDKPLMAAEKIEQDIAAKVKSKVKADVRDKVQTKVEVKAPLTEEANTAAVIATIKETAPVVKEIEKSVDITQKLRQLTADIQSNIPSHMLETKPLLVPDKVLVQESSFSKSVQKSAVEVAVVALSTKKAVPATKLQISDTAAPVVAPKVQSAKSSAQLNAKSIKAWPSSGYTLQLLGSRSNKGVLAFMKKMPNSAKMRYFQTKLKNKPWHVVVYGQYPSRAAANAAKTALPAQLKQLKPWVKSIKSVKIDINK